MFKVDFDLVKKAQKILDDNSELFEKSLCSIDALASINYNLSTQIYEIIVMQNLANVLKYILIYIFISQLL